MRFLVAERLGPKRSLTPEGYLLCQDVPIARTGTMEYAPGELDVPAGPDGIIRIERGESDVFRPETLASFEGKPVTDDHQGWITPENWSKFSCGVVQNVRKVGDLMVADMLITTQAAIDKVQGGKDEVSCGYDAQYEVLGPGRARQFEIVGNHVALVDNGRCGPRCSIGDNAMKTTDKATGDKRTAIQRAFDKLRTAMKTKDEGAQEALVKEAEDEIVGAAEGTTGGDTHVHVHMPSTDEPEPAALENVEDDDPAEKRLKGIEDSIAKIGDAVAGLAETVGKITTPDPGANGSTGDEDPDPDDKDKTKDEPDPDDKDKTKDEPDPDKKDEGTKDSIALRTVFKDTMSRAEILVPGIKLPTFDAKFTAKKTADALCAFRRETLKQAYATEDGKKAIDPFVSGKFDAGKLTCDAATMLFNGAAELVRRNNNGKAPRRLSQDSGVVNHKALTAADIQARNAKKREGGGWAK